MRWMFVVMLVCCFLVSPLYANSQSSTKVYRVAIIDRFFPPAQGFENDEERVQHGWLYGMMDLDNDDRKEPFYHGDVVRLIASHPQITFLHYPIQDGVNPMAEILDNLRNIQARRLKQPVDALLLSWESSTLISAFERPLKRENADKYKAVVKQMGEKYRVWQLTSHIIDALEQLAKQGVQVYTISGNGGRGMVNTFSFAKGVTTVGASEKELGHFVADNPFVDIHAQAAWEIVRVDNSEGKPEGYDINGDHCVDIPLNKLTGFEQENNEYPKKFWRLLTGSSFAAPAALKAALFANLPLASCHQ